MLLLASRSPQRRAILSQLGVPFEARPADVEEIEHGDPAAVAVENARAKALKIAAEAGGAAPVLGVDTMVALDHRIHGKPEDAATAEGTLRALAGRTHEVVSGLCWVDPETGPRTAAAVTLVTFRPLDENVLRWYLASEEWRDRAGGYAIQGRGAALVERIDGDFWNVVGLPVPALLDLVPGLVAA